MGNFCNLMVFERYLSNAWTHPHQILFVQGQCLPTCPFPLWGPSDPGRRGEEALKTQNGGWSHSWTAIISIFLSVAKCGSICRAQTCAHSDIEPSRSAKAFLQGGPKSSKKFEFFTISRLHVPISQKLLKIEAYKQRTKKRFIPLLSNCRICMDTSLTGFYRVGQKLSDVIPVLRITPRATEPSTVSVFLSVVKCGRVCRAQTCAHSGIEPSTLAKGFPQVGQKFRKNSNFCPFRKFTSLSQQPL